MSVGERASGILFQTSFLTAGSQGLVSGARRSRQDARSRLRARNTQDHQPHHLHVSSNGYVCVPFIVITAAY